MKIKKFNLILILLLPFGFRSVYPPNVFNLETKDIVKSINEKDIKVDEKDIKIISKNQISPDLVVLIIESKSNRIKLTYQRLYSGWYLTNIRNLS